MVLILLLALRMELFQTESVHASQVVPAWLGCLPIKDDKIEAKVVHEQLCSMVER